MAYRELKCLDLVRIVDVNCRHHGRNATVIEDGSMYVKVQVGSDGRDIDCFYIPQSKLLVRDDKYAFIVDGRIDKEAKAAYDLQQAEEFSNRNSKAEDSSQLVVMDDYGDTLVIHNEENHVFMELNGEHLVFARADVELIAKHIAKFLNE